MKNSDGVDYVKGFWALAVLLLGIYAITKVYFVGLILMIIGWWYFREFGQSRIKSLTRKRYDGTKDVMKR